VSQTYFAVQMIRVALQNDIWFVCLNWSALHRIM